MKFTKNNKLWAISRTEDITTEGTPIFKFAVWNEKEQKIDSGEVAADSIIEAKAKILY